MNSRKFLATLSLCGVFCSIIASTGGQTTYQELVSFQGDSPLGNTPDRTPIQGSDGYLYGETTLGGANHSGVVYKIKPDGTGYAVVHAFSSSQGPGLGLIQGSDGFLYGTATDNSIFKLSTDGAVFIILHVLSAANGEGINPASALAEGPDGFLYGTTSGGGANGAGTVYKINKTGADFSVLHSFSLAGNDGTGPQAGVAIDRNGVLYGSTYQGGAHNVGTLFSINSNGTNYRTIYNFDGSAAGGQYPVATMILASDGLLYGTTYQNGGPFQVTTSGGNFRFLRIFSDSVEGSFFNTGVIEGVDGALYGRSIASTQTGIGGTLFKIQKNGTAYQALYTFPVDSDPRSNFNGVIQSSSGLLLAANPIGGVGGAGILLSINSAGGSATVVYDFGAAFTGSTPNALCLASDGRLYGATGTINGTLFGINQDGSGFASLHHFMGGTFDGANPVGISSGRNGYLYGITSIGGTAGAGTVFGLRTDGSQYSVIYNFNNAGPYYPIGIIQGNDGFLYITTESGGSAGLGAICKVAVDGTGFAVIHSFSYAGFDGQMPLAGVIQASDNALYGTTSSGGTAGKGVIFKVNTDGSGYTTLHNFGASTGDGTTPRTMLIEAADGGLYGWTGDGVLFRIQKDGSQYNVKFVLSQSSAASSPTNLLQGSDGWLYSTGSIRPPLAQVPAQGQMFRIGPNGTGFAIVEALTSPCDDGSIVIASNGSFYGVTTGSSSLGQTVPGVLFKIRFALMAPGISAQPQSQSAVVGQTVSFSVVAMGTAPLTYQWMKNNSVISGATSATYTLSSVQLTDAGLYSCTIGNAGGTLASVQATLTVSPAGPPITVQPVGQTVNCGGAATLSVVAVGSALTYQWQLNGTNIAGASSSTYTIATVGTLHAGAYTVVVGGSNGISTTSAPATLIVVSNAHPIAISTRGLVGSDSNILIAGFIISGTTSETLLLRGVGPTLGSSFQVPGVLAHPQLFLFDSKGHVLASNTGWGGDPAVAQAINRVYLFPFPAGSADCAILITLPPGTYTAQVSGANSTTGVALIEVYDVPAN